MLIESIRIKNLRSFEDEVIPIDPYTCLVGPNGSGKSTILCALNIFFRQSENSFSDLTQLIDEDFHNKDTSQPIEITVVFTNLNADAQADFKGYFRNGKLVITAIAHFNPDTNKAEVKQYGQRLGINEFKEFFRQDGDNAKVAHLRETYNSLKVGFPDLPAASTKDAMTNALHDYEAEHQEDCILIQSEDQFYGVTKGANKVAKYIQWIYVPAVKDITSEQLEARNTALGKLLARTVRLKTAFADSVNNIRETALSEYESLLHKNQGALAELSDSLQKRLAQWAHPETSLRLEWRQDPVKAIRIEEPLAQIVAGESNFTGNLGRLGHGLQRSLLLALLQELAGADSDGAPRLLLGCEEPELYQHPPQARHLAEVLQGLSSKNSQIIVTTHSPTFVSGKSFENVRMVRKDFRKQCSQVSRVVYEELSTQISACTGKKPSEPTGMVAKIHQLLQPSLNEMFFTNRLILTEGGEDIAYLTTYLHLLGRWEEFRKIGAHIVGASGKQQFLRLIVISKLIKIPTFVIFDADADANSKNRAGTEKLNKQLLCLLDASSRDSMPTKSVFGVGFAIWRTNIADMVREEIGDPNWENAQNATSSTFGQYYNKNPIHIAAALTHTWAAGSRSKSLEVVCNSITDISNSIKLT
jgi:putative ATP-dependent endonuclease of OLD family